MRLTFLKKLIPIAGLFFAVLVLHKDFLAVDLNNIAVAIPPMVLGSLLLVILFYMDAVGWCLINKALGVPGELGEGVRVWLLSSFSRYIPGVVWGYANRIIYLKELHVNVSVIALSLMLESLFLAGAALIMGVNLLFFPEYFALLQLNLEINYSVIAFSLIVFLVVIVLIVCFYRLKIASYMGQIREAINFKKLLGVFLFYLILWSIFVCAFGLFSSSLLAEPLSLSRVLVIGFCFSLSFGMSFLLIIFPGGIGVREMFLYSLLSVTMDSGMAALLAALSRLWVMAGEFFSVGGCWVFTKVMKYENKGI